MKKGKLLKLILIVFLLTGIVGAGYYSLIVPSRNNTSQVLPDKLFGWKFPSSLLSKADIPGAPPPLFDLEIKPGRYLAYSDIRDPGGIPQGLPVRLKIPVIGVNSAIEDAYITSDGRMDVPAGTTNVAWFALGPHPGKEGSAVIGGHYGKYESNKGPTVFYYLDKLKIGDKVYIEDDSGNTLAFVVKKIQLFDRNADATTVFTSGDGLAHLNLITCEGAWNKVNDSYPDRRVVFTDSIPSEGPVSIKTQSIAVAKPKITPTIIPTRIPTTTPQLKTNNRPLVKISTPNSVRKLPVPFPILGQSVKSLYATPMDGLITSFLLLSIVFITFKILRR